MQLSNIVKKKISEMVVDNYPTAHVALVVENDQFSLRSRDGKIVGIEVENLPENADIILAAFHDIASFIRNEELKNVSTVFADMEKELRLECFTPENWACKNNIEMFLDQIIKKFGTRLEGVWKTLTSYHNASPTDNHVLQLRQEHADMLTCMEFLKMGVFPYPRQYGKSQKTYQLFKSVIKRFEILEERIHETSTSIQSISWLVQVLVPRILKYRKAEHNVFPMPWATNAHVMEDKLVNSIVDIYNDVSVKEDSRPVMGRSTKENIIKWYDDSNLGLIILSDSSRAKFEIVLRRLANY